MVFFSPHDWRSADATGCALPPLLQTCGFSNHRRTHPNNMCSTIGEAPEQSAWPIGFFGMIPLAYRLDY
jgi:hypothetical protein